MNVSHSEVRALLLPLPAVQGTLEIHNTDSYGKGNVSRKSTGELSTFFLLVPSTDNATNRQCHYIADW